MEMTFDFEKALLENQGRIRAIANSHADAGFAEDLYQEIVLQLWRSRNSFKAKSSINTWIYKIALNTAFTFQRNAVRSRHIKQNAIRDARPKYADSSQSNTEILNAFIANLNDIDTSILIMYLDGIKASEMADVLGLSSNAINVRVSRLKSKFEQQFID